MILLDLGFAIHDLFPLDLYVKKRERFIKDAGALWVVKKNKLVSF
tara:strand:- start:481 stop:615 length:135 start_codon:yes stop_codon:yes gene_type:complete